ncbi:hypothetical protein CGZ80_10070 [Rhodopirellula sp. MGV]|nr:hypothetical protein CGZ80_10070 [Rhodopirellula sp. MGV]
MLLDAALKCRGIEVSLRLLKDTWIPDLDATVKSPPHLCERLCIESDSMKSRCDSPEGPVPRGLIAVAAA